MTQNFVLAAPLAARAVFLLLIVQAVWQDTISLQHQHLHTLASYVDQTAKLALMKQHVYHAQEVWS